MNIFFTNPDTGKCAKDHCTIHNNKMQVEYCQLLSTAHHVLDGSNAKEGIMKATHVNHPCAVWVRQSIDHYDWLWDLASDLIFERMLHTGQVGKCSDYLDVLRAPPKNLAEHGWTDPPLCMPDEFKRGTITDAYKGYLLAKYNEWGLRDKSLFVKWHGEQPSWV